MPPTKLITVFGATGSQGSGVINTVLSIPGLKAKYSLRAVTRDLESSKAQALRDRGVDVVKADLNDINSLKAAVTGSYGVFGMTDFWSIHSQEIEVQQGKSLFDACKAMKVEHYVWSSLPHAVNLTKGVLTQLPYFDGKAIVEDYIEANKGDMIASYFWPAMFLGFIKNLVRGGHEGNPHLTLPFPNENILWPLVDPPQDGGKYIMGLFEGGRAAEGVRVKAVSCWVTPKEVAVALSKESGRDVAINTIPADIFAKDFPENITGQLTETLRMVGEYSIFGRGEDKNQAESDKWLVEGGKKKITLEEWVQQNGPWKFETASFFDTLAAQKANSL